MGELIRMTQNLENRIEQLVAERNKLDAALRNKRSEIYDLRKNMMWVDGEIAWLGRKLRRARGDLDAWDT